MPDQSRGYTTINVSRIKLQNILGRANKREKPTNLNFDQRIEGLQTTPWSESQEENVEHFSFIDDIDYRFLSRE